MIREMLLTPNKYSRPEDELLSVRKLVLHYVANPKTTAVQNRNFFELRKNGNLGYGSAHYIVDDEEIIRCIPETERAYHVGADKYTPFGLTISSYPNARTIGVEFCHPKEDGKPTEETRDMILWLLADLCKRYNLDPVLDITTHNAITGKDCPRYYVANNSAFVQLRYDVAKIM